MLKRFAGEYELRIGISALAPALGKEESDMCEAQIGQMPHFFIIGAPKCGTTSLYSWLRHRPDIHIPIKEPKFFSADVVRPQQSSLEEYLALFTNAPPGALIGEASVTYLMSQVALTLIRQHRPDARIIVLLRNPVDLAISWHGQCLKTGSEKEIDFERAWNLIARRRQGLDIPLGCPWPVQLDYERVGSIGTQLKQVMNVFPPDQVLTMLLDDIATDPRTSYLRVLKFLGLPDDMRSQFKAENTRKAYRSQKLNRLARVLRRMVAPKLGPLLDCLGIRGTGALRILDYFNSIEPDRTVRVGPMFRQSLLEHFHSEVQLIEELLGRCLPAFRR